MLLDGAADPVPEHLRSDDSLWYKDAVIYELHVRAFRDENGDGIGDFRLIQFDYLKSWDYSVWLLPFISPLRMTDTILLII